MNIIKNILAVVLGIFIGGFVNMAIINNGASFIPPPEGVNPADIESIKENMYLYTPLHFIVPFLAHAIGTLVGAIIVSFVAVSHRMYLSIGIGVFFLIGGITMVVLLPSPMWFNILDLGLAYIPMGLLGWKISGKD